jgi:signal transduction histidine kinase
VAARDELRAFARGVYPPLLTESGLAAALAELASAADFHVELAVADRRWRPDLEAAAYFVCSEALTNIEKYAHASRCLIRVAPDGAWMRVEVSDNGCGGADPAGGSGLLGLADRLSVLGGTLTVASPPGGGTRLIARIPDISR